MSTELLFSICGLMIAIAASFATVAQAWLMRKHNRLSVKPFLQIETNNILDDYPRIKIMNCGVGPAIIKEFEIYLDNETVKLPDEKEKMRFIANSLLLSEIGTNFYSIRQNEILSINDSHSLFESMSKNKTKSDLDSITKKFLRLKFSLSYNSIYNENFKLNF